MIRTGRLFGGLSSPRFLPVALLGFAASCLLPPHLEAAPPESAASSISSANAQTVTVDYLYPEAFQVATWIDVDLPSSNVQLANLRIITANRRWSLQICGSISDPATCVNPLASWDPRGVGWRGDFRSPSWSQSYQDASANKKLHLRVTPIGGDWMIFRIQLEATPVP